MRAVDEKLAITRIGVLSRRINSQCSFCHTEKLSHMLFGTIRGHGDLHKS